MNVVLDLPRTMQAAVDAAVAGHASAAALRERRQTRLARLLEAAATRSPLYRRAMGPKGALAPLNEWPVMGKTELMCHFDDWVTDPSIHLAALEAFVADPARIAEPYLGRYVVWESSGSQGVPALFVQDAAAMAVYDALEAVRHFNPRPWHRWLDPCYCSERIAFVGATTGHFAATVTAERLRRANPALTHAIHQISFMQSSARLAHELERVSPTLLGTYPSVAVLLAEQQAAGRLHIAPREIWTGGETLTPAMRCFIQDTFDCAVVNSYGASEFLAMACECRCAQLHLNTDWLILETADATGRPIDAGHGAARVLLTNLANHVQPLIRYDLGDQVQIDTRPCECGSSLPVVHIQGRCDDTLQLGLEPSTAKVTPLALSTVLEDDVGLFDFQLRQTGPCELLLQTPLRGADVEALMRRARATLARFVQRQGVDGVIVRTATGRAHRTGRTGKVQRVIAWRPAQLQTSRAQEEAVS